MYEIWEKRGTIVTEGESSYYKLVRQLRQSFKKVNINENLIMTLPRIGILYTGEKSEMPTLSKYDTKKSLTPIYDIFFQECLFVHHYNQISSKRNLMLNINPNFSKKYFFIIYTFYNLHAICL
ncbi:hypothetical protein AB6F61_07615 [Providencia hangzhouensis]|uniref:hypothetical protein n=1 Tax=Providencia hangzhouensis TaxID=3031799 RepID=UPI0034DDAF7E